jgi:DNA-binding ferritin-like protein
MMANLSRIDEFKKHAQSHTNDMIERAYNLGYENCRKTQESYANAQVLEELENIVCYNISFEEIGIAVNKRINELKEVKQ